ncbi:hypothetical protein [Bacillus sp. FJAT-26390]|nr:hypothetical protein [Bacillus sp. FJAT-26390]
MKKYEAPKILTQHTVEFGTARPSDKVGGYEWCQKRNFKPMFCRHYVGG